MIKIPSTKKCLKIMDEYDMPDNIKAHSFQVRDISVLLAKELKKKGENLNLKLIEAAALLHDIAKIHCVKSGERHDEVGADLLRSMGYDRIAEIVEQHINLREKYKKITEEEIVCYADKRVMHDKIVPLSKRFEDIKVRYYSENPDIMERINSTEEQSYRLEKKIFKNLDFSPDDLVKLLKK